MAKIAKGPSFWAICSPRSTRRADRRAFALARRSTSGMPLSGGCFGFANTSSRPRPHNFPAQKYSQSNFMIAIVARTRPSGHRVSCTAVRAPIVTTAVRDPVMPASTYGLAAKMTGRNGIITRA